MGLKPLLARLAEGPLTTAETEAAFALVMDGAASDAQIGALLMALRLRGETLDDVLGAVRAMVARMVRVDAPDGAMDVCGTGGDHAGTLNVSTAVSFVVAACGVPVAKHGNRAQSSRTGAADVLAALGIEIEPPLAELARQLRDPGLAFLFAPRHHAALRHAGPARAALGFRTVFNLVGPLANPAGVRRQLVGVYDAELAPLMLQALVALGAEAAWVVHGMGMDELTLAGPSRVLAWQNGAIRRFVVKPEEAGLRRAPISAIAGGDAAHNAAALLALLQGEPGAYRDTVRLNAAAALIVAGRASDLADGVGMAARALDGGGALAVLERLRAPALVAP